MPFELEQVSPRRWSVKNSETGTIHSKHTTKAKADTQIRLLNSIQSLTGKGLIEDKYIESLQNPSEKYPPKVPLPIMGNFDIDVPPYIIKPIEKKGVLSGFKLVKTLTKTRNLSSREGGVPSVNLVPKTHEVDATVNMLELKSTPTLDQFSKKDQAIIKKLFLKPNKQLHLENKQRGFPELMAKNIERHRQLGTSQLSNDFIIPPPKKRGRPKKTAPASAPKTTIDDINWGETPASTPRPRTPISFETSVPSNYETGDAGGGGPRPQFSLMLPHETPRTPTPKSTSSTSSILKELKRQRNQLKQEVLKTDKKTQREKYKQLKKDLLKNAEDMKALQPPTPQPPTPQPPTPQPPTPQAPSPQAPSPQAPTPQASTPQPSKKGRGRPKKYDDDAERKSIKLQQQRESSKRIYLESLTPTHREKYLKKQEKKALKGTGIFSDIKKKFVNFGNKTANLFNKVVHHDIAYPPNLTAIKNEMGNEIITSLQIGRTPVPSAISSAMNAVSLGGFDKVFKSLPYDKLFHLFIIITTDKGKFLLEKNERINVSKSIPSNDLEIRNVVIPNNLSVNTLIDNTQKYMGGNFLPYDPATQNCQDFILSLLKANNILTEELNSFVKQNTSEIFKQNPNLAKISRKLTDVGAAINVIQQGGSLRKIKSNHSNIDMDTTFYHQLPQAETQVRSSLGMTHMRGSGIFDNISRAFKSIPQKVKETAQRAADVARIPTNVKEIQDLASLAQIPTDVGGVKRYAKTGLTYGLPSLGAATLGGLAGYATGGNPYAVGAAGTVGGIVGRVGAEQANKQIGDGIGRKRRGRPRKMRGEGWFDKVLDTSFTPRQAIRLGKSVPALAREAVADIKGVGFIPDRFKMPKVRGITEPLVNVPGISSGVIPMSGRGARPAKGSPEMREKMAALRARRKK